MESQLKIFAFVFVFFSFSCIINAQNAPFNLRCSDKVNPVGTDENPSFGWYMDDTDDNEIQTAYQIIVGTVTDSLNNIDAYVWNSNKVNSGQQNAINYKGNPLISGKQYFWSVRIWDKDGNVSEYADPATFQTGLFTNSDWSEAKWIKRENTVNEDLTYYRKSFDLGDSTIKKAVVYVTAVHDFDLYLNDSLVGKGPTYHYAQYQYYNAYDITMQLNKSVQNTFACLVHWYSGGQGRPKSERGFLLKAIIEYENSTTHIVVTDSTWKQQQVLAWKTGQNTRNGEGIGYIERIDSRNFIPDWYKSNFDDQNWDASYEIGEHPTASWTGTLQPNLTRLIEEEIKPVSVSNLGGNMYVIDLGKVYAGIPQIKFSGGTPGDVVNIKGGFTLDNGSVSNTTTQNTDMRYFFILDGDTSIFRPMVYLGMRYIQVDNSPNILNTDNVSFISRHYELDHSRSSFSSSNHMLNLVWNLMKHSLILGSQESFVDTPTREKGGFLGDSWSIGAAAMTTMGDRVMNKRILLEFMDSQDQYWPDGRLNAVYPNVDGKRDIPDYTQMYLVWVWDYYMQSGDTEFLKNNYGRLKKVADYVDSYKNTSTGLIHNLAGGSGPYEYGIIDWPAQMRYNYDMATVSRTVMDAYAYTDFDILSKIAGVIDSTDDQSIYEQKALAMKKAINESLVHEKLVYVDGLKSDHQQSTIVSQQANTVPLALGIVPEANVDSVVNQIKSQKMKSGMVTLRWLPEALGRAEEGGHLVDLYTNSEWDGWAKSISLGATATWESWDAIENGQSLSHPWGAVGLLGIQQYILGVTALKPQHELVQIKPLDCVQKLDYVSGILPTDRGDIEIDWQRSDSLFTLSFTIPNNMTAKVYVPKSETTGDTVLVNNVKTQGVDEGKYIYVGEMGSGSYTIQREADTSSIQSLPLPPVPVTPPVSSVDENNLNNHQAINMYPNPSYDYTTVDLRKENSTTVIRVQNMVGETLKEFIFEHTRYCDLNLSDIKKGVYIINIITSERQNNALRLFKL